MMVTIMAALDHDDLRGGHDAAAVAMHGGPGAAIIAD